MNSIAELPRDSRVGVIGSDTTTGRLTVDLVADSRTRSLAGKLVVVAPTDHQGDLEYGIGTVTEILTTNTWHENPSLRGVIANYGAIGNLTGAGDIKTAIIKIQAGFREGTRGLRPVGGSLTFAPSTGENVHLATNELINSLATRATTDVFSLGTGYRQPEINFPLTFHDFSGSRGAEMAAILGPSGGGKTFFTTLFVAATTRHRNMAFLLIDPQGQFATTGKVKRDLPLDLRALAESQGRDVQQLSVAQEVRLPEDPGMLCDLLAGAAFFGAARLIGARNNAKEAQEVVLSWLESGAGTWSDRPAEELLNAMLDNLIERIEAGAVAVGATPIQRMSSALTAARHSSSDDGTARRASLLGALTPFLSMFSSTGPGGAQRVKMSEIVRALCESDTGYAGNRKGRPFYVLTLADQVNDSNCQESEVGKALKQSKTQMVIMRTLFSALEGHARWLYQSEDQSPANLMVVMDEAARFTSDSHRNPEQRAMAEDMARYFRELRKYAIGFTLILQEPSMLHDSIWKQLQNGFRAFASGLTGNDLDKVREQVGGPDSLRLYQQLARPSKDNPVYPWALCGNISPLNVTAEALFMEAFTDVDDWAAANSQWLPGAYNVNDLWAGKR